MYNKFNKNVSKTSSKLCPNAILLHPSLIATLFIIPLLKFAHNEHGFFSFLTSNTISFILLFSTNKGTPISSQFFCNNSLSNSSNPGFIDIAINSKCFG